MKNRRISPYLLVMISFLGGILVGGFLLSTPFAQKVGHGEITLLMSLWQLPLYA